jgi:hypothetical protein
MNICILKKEIKCEQKYRYTFSVRGIISFVGNQLNAANISKHLMKSSKSILLL